MALSSRLVTFLRAWEALAQMCKTYPWGTVTGDSRFVEVHDANRALVAGDVTPNASEVLDALADMHDRVSVAFDQVEIVDIDAHAHLCAELRDLMGEPQRFRVMTLGTGAQPPSRDESIDVRETVPDLATWTQLKRSFAEGAPDAVVPRLARRDLEVFARHGARYFCAHVGGEPVAASSLLTLSGVSLIDDVVTLPEHRDRGLGSAVTAAAIDAARRAGAEEAMLFAADSGDAQRIYRRLGFEVTAMSEQFHGEHAGGA